MQIDQDTLDFWTEHYDCDANGTPNKGYVQLMVSGNAEMFDAEQQAKVISIETFRHAGDSRDGNDNSWFVVVTARVVSTKGNKLETPLSLKVQSQHGHTAKRTTKLAEAIMTTGKINCSLWSFVNYNEGK